MTGDIQWFPSRPGWAQAATLFGAFGGAVLLGYLLGRIMLPGSDAVMATGTFAFLLAFILGYSLWAASIAAVVSGGLLKGLLRAALRFVVSKDKKDLEAARRELQATFGDEARLKAMIAKIRKRAGVYRWLGLVFGALAGAVVGLLGSRFGFLGTALLYGLIGLAYGMTLTRLTREGYMPPPDDIDIEL